MTARADSASSKMEVEPLPYALGACVTGIDLRGLSDAAFAAIREAWLEHLVIVIRGGRVIWPRTQKQNP